MNTWLKIALTVVGAVAALFVILVVAVTLIIEPNDYRPYIVSAVEDATGRSFEVPGDLGLSLLPCCSVSVGASRLGNPPGFADDEFASFESASLSLKLWPLLTRSEVQIGTVTLDGPDVNLTRLEDGRVNWEFEDAAEADSEPEASDPALAGLSVAGLALRNGRIRYRDAAAGQDYTASDVRLDTGIAMAGERLTMNGTALSATVNGNDMPADGADISVSADALVALLADDVVLSVEGMRAEVRALESRLQISGGGTAGDSLAMTGEFTLERMSPRDLLAALSAAPYEPVDDDALTRLTASGAWTLGNSFFKIDGIDVQVDDSRLTGSASLDDFDTAAARFDLVLDRLDVDRYSPAAAGGDTGSSQAEPTVIPLAALADVELHGNLRIDDLRAAGVAVNELQIEIAARAGTVTVDLNGQTADGGFALDGRGNVSSNEPQLSGNLKVDGVSPRTLLQELDADMATADPDVLRSFSGNSRWRLTPRTLTLEDMRWQLDDTTATGRFAVADFDTLASRFDIALDRLNVDAYLAPDEEDVAAGEAQTEIPVEVVRALNLDGRLRAGEMTLLGLLLRNATATVSAADGVLRLDPLAAAALYQQAMFAAPW
ncbi:MAG: AsmA family protein [Gammaproteobacteria bacterium]|nr:AsmA family protein [Gammaproteobacteria bacterium]